MVSPKRACWKLWPFDADLVLRKTGVRRRSDPTVALGLLGQLAQEHGMDVRYVERNARLTASERKDGEPSQSQVLFVKEQQQLGLVVEGRLFFLSGATGWEEELLKFHQCLIHPLKPRQVVESFWMGGAEEKTMPPVDPALLDQARALIPTPAQKHVLSTLRPFPEGSGNPGYSYPPDRVAFEIIPDTSTIRRFWASVAKKLSDLGWPTEAFLSVRVMAPSGLPLDETPPTQIVRRRFFATTETLFLHNDSSDINSTVTIESAFEPHLLTVAGEYSIPSQHNALFGDVERVIRQLQLFQLNERLPDVAEPPTRMRL